ncbi:dual specificity mitogen-activated protein kinase kinase 6-like isoform X1 [Lineus longissimus]|uniref:dual specificity mitogen-activated protein kinase kinase 6-like isoform X1 n=1 Tax=Lineus longissimus TaxID=88925 RepID=UPI002B4D3A86
MADTPPNVSVSGEAGWRADGSRTGIRDLQHPNCGADVSIAQSGHKPVNDMEALSPGSPYHRGQSISPVHRGNLSSPESSPLSSGANSPREFRGGIQKPDNRHNVAGHRSANKGRKKPPGMGLKINVTSTPPPKAGPPRELDDRVTITVDDKVYDVKATDLERLGELGRGAYGVVEKRKHTPSGLIMAVKRIHCTVNSEEQKRLLMDLDVSMRSGNCVYMVKFYGALFREGDVWICMEVMDTSLDKFYTEVYPNSSIPEPILAKIATSVVKALDYLHSKLKVIHRDVKPSNILINRGGDVKICDFGISGQLVDSIAKTMEAGCKPYMAPERINPDTSSKGYDIKSDVWSFGITLFELATGQFPYTSWKTPFEQLKQVVHDDPPRLPPGKFSEDFEMFMESCLQKNCADRKNYKELLSMPFIIKAEERDAEVDLAAYVQSVLGDNFNNTADIQRA